MPIPAEAFVAGGKAVAWLWDEYGKALVDKAAGNFKKKWAEVQWVEAAQKYRERMLELHGTLRVLGKPEPVSLEGVFTDVFILDQPRAFRRFDMARLREDPNVLDNEQAKRVSGLRLVTQPKTRRLFILGPPGAGKTTFLKYLTLQAAQGKLNKIPIFVPLNEWSESDLELLPFIARQFEICAFPDARAFIEHILKEGDALVLFDGLDEVRQEGAQRANVIKTIRDFSNQHSKSQVLVTCRVAATEYELSDKFTYVELADFTRDQMRAYAHKWFSDNPQKGQAFETEFFDKAEHRGLREMGRTPLLLAMLCLHFEETQTFPQRHIELYEEALDALLKKWDTSRNIRRDEVYRKLSLGRKRELLATLAAESFDREELFFAQEDLERRIVAYLRTLPPADIDEDIDGEVVLKAIEAQHGVLVERAHRIHAFAHLSFQEYFTAKYVVDNNALARLLTIKHIQDPRWREVLKYTASMLSNADAFFEHFCCALNNSVYEDRQLTALLQWADAKAHPPIDDCKIGALRAIYIYLARTHIMDLNRGYKRGRALAHNLARARDRDQARDLAHALDYAHSHAHTLNLTCNLSLDNYLERALALDLARDLTLASAYAINLAGRQAVGRAIVVANTHAHYLAMTLAQHFTRELAYACDIARNSPPQGLIVDFCLVNTVYFALILSLARKSESVAQHTHTFTDYLQDIATLAEKAEIPILTRALTTLCVPHPDASQATWDNFVNDVEQLLAYRDLHNDFGLRNDSQIKKLTEYVVASRLFVECLSLARVTDREGIEARILQPPGVADNELGNE